jgi:CubicO group peptidase (beta-lactamase class C family)
MNTPKSSLTPTFTKDAITAFMQAAHREVGGLHGLVIYQHGKQIAEHHWAPYKKEDVHLLYSLSKSFCSTAAGLAIAEGFFSLDDTVISFFPEEISELPETISENLAKMRVRDLLCMGTGHDTDSTGSLFEAETCVKGFFSHPVIHTPGTHFVYNSGATYMVSAIVTKTTGERLLDYLTPRLLAPLGIEGATWEQSPQGIDVGGWGMSVKTTDIAKFGQLYLQNGIWEGKQLLPEGWVADATRSHISNGDPNNPNDWHQGYGFQFWRCRHNAYRGDGAFGQYCVVMPDQDAVVAITSNVDNMQTVLNLAWDYFLHDKEPEANLPALPLEISSPMGKATSSLSIPTTPYIFSENDQKITDISCAFTEKTATFVINAWGATYIINVGNGYWHESETSFNVSVVPSRPTAGKGAWINDNTYQFCLCYSNAPFTPTFTLTFGEDDKEVQLGIAGRFGFDNPDKPVLVGRQ